MGSYFLMDKEFQCGMIEKFWRWAMLMSHNNVNVFNAIELDTQKWLKW